MGKRIIRIFFQDIHGTLTESIAWILRSFNAILLLGDDTLSSVIGNVGKYHTRESIKAYGPNVQLVSFQELLDAPPDIIWLSCIHVEAGILNNLWPHLRQKSKLIMFDGNNYSQGRQYGAVRYVVTSDQMTWKHCSKEKPTLFFYPPCDYNKFPWQGHSDSKRIGCYINKYSQMFPRDFAFSRDIQSLVSGKNIECCVQ
jgi:hypothetical protein